MMRESRFMNTALFFFRYSSLVLLKPLGRQWGCPAETVFVKCCTMTAIKKKKVLKKRATTQVIKCGVPQIKYWTLYIR